MDFQSKQTGEQQKISRLTMTSFKNEFQTMVPLPVLDFGMADLKSRMAQFTVRFDTFVLSGRERLLQGKLEFAASMAEDRMTQKSHSKSLEQYKQIELDCAASMVKERAEVEQVQSSISVFSAKKQMMAEQQALLEIQVEQIKVLLQKKRELRSQQRQKLAEQNAKNAPELKFWETHLGMKIEAAGTDRLKFIFNNIDENDWNTEFHFIVDISQREYERNLTCFPDLADSHSGRMRASDKRLEDAP